MIFNEKISLEEIDGQKFKIRVIEPESNSNAVITHYVHNNKNGVSRSYKKDAIKFTKEILEYKFPDEEITLKVAEEALQYGLFDTIDIPFPPVKNPKFTFIDLFAGIGGFRLALQQMGGKCIFTSEWDKNAKKTYRANFGEIPFGDITKKSVKEYIPEKFDVLCAGFPCQPFSKGGFQNGFEDTRGTLFFDICEIVKKHQPKFIFLENVSNLVTHDNGNTYKVILEKLEKLGYSFPNEPLIISPDKFGIPVLRPRIYIPCVRNDLAVKNLDLIQNFKKNIENYFVKELQSIDSIIDDSLPANRLSEYEMKILNLWNDFYKGISLKIIGFPIRTKYFRNIKIAA